MRTLIPLLFTCLFASTAMADRPKLGILIVFDQLRAADVERNAPFFPNEDFGGLRYRGAAQLLARYNYASAETGPGHATLATGTHPYSHGISSNRWWINGDKIYSVDDKKAGRGPEQLMAPTLGDSLKIESGGVGRVVTLSVKDRSAILTAGHTADLALWYSPESGRFETSTHYVSKPPDWSVSLNVRVARHQAEGTWRELPIPKNLESLLMKDARSTEGEVLGGITFPHDIAKETDEKKKSFYRATPQALEDLFWAARVAVAKEKLGSDAQPDLLVICVSVPDYIGHWFGPLSREMTDILRRSDREVRNFIGFLDKRLGKDGYALAVASDHGSTTLVENAQAQGYPASRVDYPDFYRRVEKRLQKLTKTKKTRVEGIQPPQLWVDVRDLSPKMQKRALLAAADEIEESPGVRQVLTRAELATDASRFAESVRQSFYPARSGQLFIEPTPYSAFDGGEMKGTDHGTPYLYDTLIPIWFLGKGIEPGRHAYTADVRDVITTLAYQMRTSPPALAEGKILPIFGQ